MYEPITRELARELWTLPRTLNELLDGQTATRSTNLVPAVDVVETDASVRLFVDCPGLSKDSLNVSIEGRTLTITGEKARPDAGETAEWVATERRYGTFSRSFTVSGHVDTGKIEAHYKDGVLEIILGKNPEAQPRKIKIEA